MSLKIILEGPDNAGKTTLARRIHSTGVTYWHAGGPPKDAAAEDECVREQLRILRDEGTYIMDRCTPISQQVYNSDMIRDGIRNTYLMSYRLLKPVIVYCRPTTDWLMSFENFTWRDGETEEHKQKVIRRQHEFIGRYDTIMARVPHVHYNWREDGCELVVQHLKAALTGSQISIEFLHKISSLGGM